MLEFEVRDEVEADASKRFIGWQLIGIFIGKNKPISNIDSDGASGAMSIRT